MTPNRVKSDHVSTTLVLIRRFPLKREMPTRHNRRTKWKIGEIKSRPSRDSKCPSTSLPVGLNRFSILPFAQMGYVIDRPQGSCGVWDIPKVLRGGAE